jgi:hypothetical protein
MRRCEIIERRGEERKRKSCGFVVDYGLRQTLGARIAVLTAFGGGEVDGEKKSFFV